MTIETVVGTLAEAYKSLRPESILHADELMKERQTNKRLRHQDFYTADGEIYFLQGRKKVPTLAMTRGSSNPLFKDSTIDAYCQQLTKNHNYHPTADEISRALHAPDTVVVDLTKLGLEKGIEEECSYLTIDTQNYNGLDPEEQKLAERVYGKGRDFGLTMKMLAKAGINETRVFVLNPGYVRIHAAGNSFGRASWLYSFDDSHFVASDCRVGEPEALRGVRRKIIVSGKC